ncbi:hypothetical protein BBL88_06345 [Vibrio parahaemolyticus]|uniref:hypothetical protein n=1 Tax=Vibrio parahaemolyticus TaxID=670 RepID=UPI00084B6925|nr:hypothetical protein [Vibrio parahaemolyticus]ODW58656.1 hypothetical protein BBL88_06345 [Vibrio parahaemolyticus]
MTKQLRQLDDIDSSTSIDDKLKKCAVLDIPVLIKAPVSMDVWAIDPKLEQLTKEDVVLSKPDIKARRLLKMYLMEDQQLSLSGKPCINTSDLSASTKLNHVEYLELKNIDINRIVSMGQVDIRRFDAVLIYNDGTHDLKLHQSVPVPRYNFSFGDTDILISLINTLVEKNKFSDQDLDYVLCKRNISGKEKYNHPIDFIETFSVTASECWILDEHVNDLRFEKSSYEESRYFLEPKYHISTSFVKLSEVAYEILDKGGKTPDGMIKYVESKHSSLSKKHTREGGARFINIIIENGRNDYFERLKEIFERFWLAQPVKDTAGVRRVAQDVVGALEIELELKSSNANGVEMILRPDKFKKIIGT